MMYLGTPNAGGKSSHIARKPQKTAKLPAMDAKRVKCGLLVGFARLVAALVFEVDWARRNPNKLGVVLGDGQKLMAHSDKEN